jgi:hypothetical protein
VRTAISPLLKEAAKESIAPGLLLPPYQGGLGGIPNRIAMTASSDFRKTLASDI